MPELVELDIKSISEHPDNPRIRRDDVVEMITASLNGEYPKEHAIHVRPIGDVHQIVSGHHRYWGATAKKFKTMWAWVSDMTDEEAYMALATSNAQGEMDAIEYARHIFKGVPKAEAGRGKKGGLAAYAASIGRTKQWAQRLWDAGEVLDKSTSQLVQFRGKAEHLSTIHKLPSDCWEMCCDWMIANEASVGEVKERVELAMSLELPECQCDGYFTESICRSLSFCKRFDQVSAKRLADLCDKVAETLDEDLRGQWFEFLRANATIENSFVSYDLRRCQEKRVELETTQWERENANTQPEDSPMVSVLLADPPWRYDFAETDSRQIENQYPTADAEEIATHLKLPWAPQLAEDCVLFMWATAPKLREAFVVLDGWGFEYKTHAVWDKEKIGMGYWFRGQHELLLVATKGSMPPPEAEARVSSVFREKRNSKHSKKPVCVYEAIEKMFPDSVKFEMYQRDQREGWLGGGNESGS